MGNKELANKYIKEAYDIIGDDFECTMNGVSFKIENNTDQNVATEKEWQLISIFLNRLNNSDIVRFQSELTRRDYHTILGEARMFLVNENDNVYFEKVFNIISTMMMGEHPTGTRITAIGMDGSDVTANYLKELRNVRKKIKDIIKKSDLKFIYNGYLFHSDPSFSKQYMEALQNKTLELIEFKNVILVTQILQLLKFYTNPLRLFVIPE